MPTNTSIKEKSKIKIKKPEKYKVVMYNDDFTDMNFVIYILVSIFNKNNLEATDIMMKVHKDGKSVAGVFSYDIARTKVTKATTLARKEGYPFRLEVEKL